MSKYLKNIGIKSKFAFEKLSKVNFKKRNRVLQSYGKLLKENKKRIFKENSKDIKECKREELIDRLIIDDNKIESIRNSINQIAKFRDPIGKIVDKWKRPNKLLIKDHTNRALIIYEQTRCYMRCIIFMYKIRKRCYFKRYLSLNSIKFYQIYLEILKNKWSDKNCIQFINKK